MQLVTMFWLPLVLHIGGASTDAMAIMPPALNVDVARPPQRLLCKSKSKCAHRCSKTDEAFQFLHFQSLPIHMDHQNAYRRTPKRELILKAIFLGLNRYRWSFWWSVRPKNDHRPDMTTGVSNLFWTLFYPSRARKGT